MFSWTRRGLFGLATLGVAPSAHGAPPDAVPTNDQTVAPIEVESGPPRRAEATPAPEVSNEPTPPAAPPPRVAEEVVRVAVGLSPEAPGSPQEVELVDSLEEAAKASPIPATDVRRLRAGSAGPRTLCREGRDDLVIVVGYLPDRVDPVLLPYDCALDTALPARSKDAASDPRLVGVLWDERRDRVAQGARERRRLGLNPKARTALIAGGAVVVLGAAVGLVLAGVLRRDTVVLTVEPE